MNMVHVEANWPTHTKELDDLIQMLKLSKNGLFSHVRSCWSLHKSLHQFFLLSESLLLACCHMEMSPWIDIHNVCLQTDNIRGVISGGISFKMISYKSMVSFTLPQAGVQFLLSLRAWVNHLTLWWSQSSLHEACWHLLCMVGDHAIIWMFHNEQIAPHHKLRDLYLKWRCQLKPSSR